MKDLRDWYHYLEGISTGSAAAAHPSPPIPPAVGRRSPKALEGPKPVVVEPRKSAPQPRSRRGTPRQYQERLPIDLGVPARTSRKAGRPPLTESREETIRRVLDPELTLHEAAALLNLSKATVRRYTDQGKLSCMRTAGGQRRFRLSEVLALLDQRPQAETAS